MNVCGYAQTRVDRNSSCLFVVAVRVSMQGWEEMYPEISEVQPQERV